MAKEDKTEVAVAQSNQRNYEIVGLKIEDYMPLEYAGQMYNLAALRDNELKILIDAGCPFVVGKK